jgi:uncharacterized protein
VKDDKVLLSSSGLMIDACATASLTLSPTSSSSSSSSSISNDEIRDLACGAIKFIRQKMTRDGNKNNLCRIVNPSAIAASSFKPALLDDLAFFTRALISSYASGLSSDGDDLLSWAIDLVTTVEKDFAPADGKDISKGYYMTPSPSSTSASPSGEGQAGDDVSTIPFRPRSVIDGAVPSGTSVHLENMIRLAALTGK